jgi:hypothetical protein
MHLPPVNYDGSALRLDSHRLGDRKRRTRSGIHPIAHPKPHTRSRHDVLNFIWSDQKIVRTGIHQRRRVLKLPKQHDHDSQCPRSQARKETKAFTFGLTPVEKNDMRLMTNCVEDVIYPRNDPQCADAMTPEARGQRLFSLGRPLDGEEQWRNGSGFDSERYWQRTHKRCPSVVDDVRKS